MPAPDFVRHRGSIIASGMGAIGALLALAVAANLFGRAVREPLFIGGALGLAAIILAVAWTAGGALALRIDDRRSVRGAVGWGLLLGAVALIVPALAFVFAYLGAFLHSGERLGAALGRALGLGAYILLVGTVPALVLGTGYGLLVYRAVKR